MARYSNRKIRLIVEQLDNATNTAEKGERLEELAKYLFEKIPGVEFFEKNILDAPRAHEIDVAFWNPQNISRLSFLDAVLIVECKNHADPVGSNAVGWFIRKLQDRGITTAVLLSLSGITGSRDGVSNAHSEILNAMVRDGIRVLVLTRREILRLTDSQDLVVLLKDKLLQLILHRTVSLDVQ